MSEAPEFKVQPRDTRDTARARFYLQAQQNKAKSDAAGQPVFDEVEMVHILVPGDRLTEVTNFVRDEHRQRWPEAYRAFKAGLEEPVQGTPLSEWAGIGPGQLEELRFAKVKTVEELAALPDNALAKSLSMGGQSLREKAQRYVASAAGSAPMERLAAENAQQKATIDQMQAQMADLLKRIDALSAQGGAPT